MHTTEATKRTTQAESTAADTVRQEFTRLHGMPARIFRAPGRVNLIGEHTDYNDGFVMPAALEFYTYVAAGWRDDRKLGVYAFNFDQTCLFDLDTIGDGPSGQWSDYVRGVAAVLQARGHQLRGANLVIKGEVPIGAGLSSSAAIEVATALALLAMANLSLDRKSIAQICQQAEHEYAGTKCGIMDQFVACFGQANQALLLDCRSLEYQLLPVDASVRIVICNTNVKHDLASGEYNLRRADCEGGVQYLSRYLPGIRALRDVTAAQLDEFGGRLPEITYRRCRHVVTENARVLAAAEALKSGNLRLFGDLMLESHRSLQFDYEVSSPELDLMVNLAQSCPGVLGARMTGGGFGGCTVNLVRAEDTENFSDTIKRQYQAASGLQAEVYICMPGDGASEIGATQS